jgi:hypothetical protein
MKISPNFTEEDWSHLYDDSHVCHANFATAGKHKMLF